jgi:thiosulfate dehydrogenase [quinone] large subunit
MTTDRPVSGADATVDRVGDRVDEVATRFGPATVRWVLGLMWLSNVNWKVPTEFGALRNFVQEGIDHEVVPGSAWVLEEVVRPRIAAFGWVTLFVEVGVAAALLAGRFVRVAAVVSALQAVAIGLSVANAPNEWYWAYLLMIGLSIAVLSLAPGDRPHSPRLMGVVVAVYGIVVALTNAEAGLTGDDNLTRTLFTGRNDIPDEFGVSMFPGSILLGLAFVALGVGAWLLAAATPEVRRVLGWAVVGVAAVLLVTYRATPDDLVVGLGSRAVHCGVLAALGLSLLPGGGRSTAP